MESDYKDPEFRDIPLEKPARLQDQGGQVLTTGQGSEFAVVFDVTFYPDDTKLLDKPLQNNIGLTVIVEGRAYRILEARKPDISHGSPFLIFRCISVDIP